MFLWCPGECHHIRIAPGPDSVPAAMFSAPYVITDPENAREGVAVLRSGDDAAVPVAHPIIRADGTLPELCLPSEDGKSKPHAGTSTCEACRIAATALLPTPSDDVGTRLPLIAAVALPQPAEAHYRQLFPPASHPRAPPITV